MRCAAALVVLVAIAACTSPPDSNPIDQSASVPEWLAAAAGNDRAAAGNTNKLALLGPEDAAAIPALMAALSCPNEPAAAGDHHDHASQGARDHASQGAGDHTHGGCNDHVVIAAATGLGAIGGAAVPPLLERLRTGTEVDRTFAGYALARMRPSAVPALLAALDDPDARIRVAIIGSIRGMEYPPFVAAPAIAARLTDADVDVRIQAADALGRFGAKAMSAVVAALDDGDAGVRASAASALRQIGRPAHDRAPVLRGRLTDADARVRSSAAAALAAIKADDTETVRGLIAALADPDPTVRTGAILALEGLGKASDARPELERACSDENALVRATANESVAALINAAK
jgi:HEAT repeat protein